MCMAVQPEPPPFTGQHAGVVTWPCQLIAPRQLFVELPALPSCQHWAPAGCNRELTKARQFFHECADDWGCHARTYTPAGLPQVTASFLQVTHKASRLYSRTCTVAQTTMAVDSDAATDYNSDAITQIVQCLYGSIMAGCRPTQVTPMIPGAQKPMAGKPLVRPLSPARHDSLMTDD